MQPSQPSLYIYVLHRYTGTEYLSHMVIMCLCHHVTHVTCSPPAQLQCLRSGVEEPGNEARLVGGDLVVVWSHSQTLSTVHKWSDNETAVETTEGCQAIYELFLVTISFSFYFKTPL